MQSRALPIVRIGRPMLPAQAQMQLELCRQLQEGQCPLVASQRISWLQVIFHPAWQKWFSDIPEQSWSLHTG